MRSLTPVVFCACCQALGSAASAPSGAYTCEDAGASPSDAFDDTASLLQLKIGGAAEAQQPSWDEDKVCEQWKHFQVAMSRFQSVSLPTCAQMKSQSQGAADVALPAALRQGLAQVFDSLLMKPVLPSAAVVAAACPKGKDCTPSAVIDGAKRLLPWRGMCYNAPYYFAQECIVSGLSPMAKREFLEPEIVRGRTCEDLAYTRWPAEYATTFYGWGNNVSMFVSGGVPEWIPYMSLVGTCKECVSALLDWGTKWREDHPQCSGPSMP